MYLLIAYKPSSDDYCRGCHMASYSSDLCIINNLTLDEVINEASNFLCKNEFLDCNEVGYNLSIFKNGVQIVGDSYPYIDRLWINGLTDEENQEEDELYRIAGKELWKQIEEKTVQKIKDRIKKQKENEQKRKLELEQKEKERKLKEYEKLRSELGL